MRNSIIGDFRFISVALGILYARLTFTHFRARAQKYWTESFMNLLGPAKISPDKRLGLAKVNRILTRRAYCDKSTGIFPYLE